MFMEIPGLQPALIYCVYNGFEEVSKIDSNLSHLVIGNCSASLVADRLMSRRDVSCGGEGPRGVDFGCIVRQFVSEPHDDAARRSLPSFAFREGCLDRGAAGAG